MWRRTCQEDAAERLALREPGRGAGLPGSLGRTLGRHAHPRHHQAPGGGDVRRREALRCCRCRWSRSATTSTASGACTWMAASKSMPLTTARRRAGSAARCKCSGTACSCACWIRGPDNCCASTAPEARRPPHPRRGPATAHTTSHPPTAGACRQGRATYRRSLRADLPTHGPRLGSPPHPGRALAGQEARRPRPRTKPAPPLWKWACPSIASCAAAWNAARKLL